ncbi:MAG: restriction endonuclease subunit S [Treponema sp.]|nr:restriction endonuclease subunit S [Treponema sp.]
MSNIPKLRFPEFKGEWEEKKLGDIASFSKGKGYTKNDLVNDGSPIILYGRMYTKYETVISDIDTFVNLQKGSIISKGGEIIVPASGETAEEISRASVVKNKGIILGGDLNIISLQKDKYNPEFFALTISSGTSQKRLSKLAQGKSVVHLHNEDLSGLQIKVPSLAEQQKIADFLSNVDSIITAETKILKTLQKKKKALMQKLFTQQLRFKSDDGTDFPAWEEKKLGDVCETYSGGTPKSGTAEYYGGEIPFIRSGEISSNKTELFLTEKGMENSSAKMVSKGDILYALYGANSGLCSISKIDGAINQAILCIKTNENKRFLCNYLQYQREYFYSTYLQGGQGNLSGKLVESFIIPLPCKEEQQKIADCLSSMDSLIQTQQKVVTTWQQRKKALLQQMFI